MKKHAIVFAFSMLITLQCAWAQHRIPHLEPIGDKLQLVVEDQPFVMLAGELGNSTATTMESMDLVWPRLKELQLNTVLVPIYWELLEPEEDVFDFHLVEALVEEARRQKLKIVFLWFGSWKNSMSSHVPSWIKLNQKRFPRAQSREGVSQEILSPFSENNMKADQKAYRELMRHIREIDEDYGTVIMVQPENEIGMLPSARDHHPQANKMFNKSVPDKLMEYLQENKASLNPEFLEIWEKKGCKTHGNWEEVFGEGLHTDEIFMAYYFARYTEAVCAAGKEEYPIPAFVNAALNRPGRLPGEYPSAGPLPHLLDVWKAVSPSIDFYAPDFYTPRFKHWNDLYVRQGNPLFIPEHRFDNSVAAKALFAFGHYEALGFSPFSIEQNPGSEMSAKEKKLARVYAALKEIKPLLDEHRGQHRVEGILLDREHNKDTFTLGEYYFEAGHTHNLGWEPESEAEQWEHAAALIVQTGDYEFFYVGFGISLTMKSRKDEQPRVGILKAERGSFEEGEWQVFQHLNGDQTHQGRHIRSFMEDVSIQRFMLYTYQ